MCTDNFILKFDKSFDYHELISSIDKLETKYDFLQVTNIGKSILNRSIPLISLGKGKKSVIYIGGHHGMEWITSALLVNFLDDICNEYVNGTTIFDISTRVLFETRKIHIVPMLNPDGIDYAIHGVSNDNILKSRLLRMNANDDFSHWQSNARGVDLNHNYNSGFNE